MPDIDSTWIVANEVAGALETLRALERVSTTWVTVLGPSCEAGPGWENRLLALATSRSDVGCACGSVRAFRGARSVAGWYEGPVATFSWFGSTRSRLADLTPHPRTEVSAFADGRGFVARTELLRRALTAAPGCSVEGAGLAAAALAHAEGMVCLCDTSVFVVQSGPAMAEIGTAARARRAEDLGYDVVAAHTLRGGLRGFVPRTMFLIVGQTVSPGALLLPLFVHKRSRFEVWSAAMRGRRRALEEVPDMRDAVRE